jgi:FkbM family methyltransferase
MSSLKRQLNAANPTLARRLRWKLAKRSDLTRVAVDHLVRHSQTVVDIGASDGVFTERLSHLVSRTGHVHAFEANPEDADILGRVAERCRNVSVHMVGLSDHDGDGRLHVPVLDGQRRLGRASVVVPNARHDVQHESLPVVLRRLDDVLADTRDSIAFVKCDVEGHEHEVLSGARQMLSTSLPTLLIEIEQRHRDLQVAKTFGLLEELGYSGFGIRGRQLLHLADFDLERDQLSFLEILDASPDADAPADYVHNFLFVPERRPLPPALLKRLQGRESAERGATRAAPPSFHQRSNAP